MIKILRFLLFAAFIVLFAQYRATAQNCTINAGSDRTLCPGQPFTLTGSATGLFAQQAVWSQIAGPAVTVSATTVSSGSATATVTGYTKGVTYTFRLTAKCTDGSPVFDDVNYTASAMTVANAGPDLVTCPGTLTMAANAVKTGETGVWSVVSGNLPVPSPATSPTATVSLPTTGNQVGTTVFRWTITDSGGNCTSSDDISVTNLGGVSPVTASSPIHVSCYTLTAAQQLSASYGGAANGQQGTWSFISGPSTPTFDDIHNNNTTIRNLIGGVYKIRWTVVGQCVNGSADVTLNVDNPSQDVTKSSNPTFTYCDGRTSTVLTGEKPLYTNETVKWTASGSNPTAVTFSDDTAPTTTVTGLNGSGNYDFTYTISNSVTGCSSSGTYHVRYTAAPTVTIGLASPQLLGCNITQLSIPYTTTGGNLTQWALISAPAGSTLQSNSGLNNYTTASGSPQLIAGMNQIGTYVIRFKRTNSGGAGGCDDAYADISIVISRPPYQANAGTSQFLACGTTSATLAGNAPQAGDVGTGQWSQVSGPNTALIADKNLNTTNISGLTSGVYVFRWMISGGNKDCGNTQSDVKVIVASNPTVVSAGSDISTCFGTPVKLDGNQPQPNETGTWTAVTDPTSSVVFSNIHDPQAVVTGLQSNQIYNLRWTISNSCGSITDDVTINTSGTNGPKQAIAGANQCLNSGTTSFTLAGNAPSAGETGTWTLLPGAPNTPVFTASANNTTVTGAVNGTYQFEWKLDAGGCTTTRDTVVITISPTTTVASITGAPSQDVCGTGAITLTGNTPAATEIGTWTQISGPGGAVITSPNSPVTTVTGLVAASYKFRWTISNNACSSSFADITYNLSEPPTTANAGSDQIVCDVTTATLAANTITAGTGLWSVISGPNTPAFSSSSNPTATISGLTLGTYVLRWTATNGPYCPASTDDVSITVGQSARAGADQNLCNTTTTVLSGNEGSTGTWTNVTGPNTPTVTTNSANTAIVTGMIPGTYTFRYTITAGGCGTLTDDVNVTVSGPPSAADAGADQQLCTSSGTSVTLTAVAPVTGTGAWSIIQKPKLTSPASFSSASNATTTLNNLTDPGVYILQWTVTNANCTGVQSNNDIVRVTVYDPPTTAQPMTNQPSACKDNVILTGTTPLIGVGTWTLVSGPNVPTIDAPNSPSTTVSGLMVSATPYVFRWTIANGVCTASSQDVSVTVKDNTPTVAAAGSNQSTCTNAIGGTGSVTLAANAPNSGDTGTWTVVTQPSGSPVVNFANVNDPTTIASNLKAGAYTFRWTISNLSSCTSQSDVTITAYDPPSVADAGPASASFCLYAPVTLAAITPTSGTGTWSVISKPSGADDPVFSNANANNATVNGLIAGNYTFRWTTSNGPCTISTDDITVTINTCEVAVAKENVGTPVPQSDGSYDVTLKFHVQNTGNASLSTLQVTDDLKTTTFPSPKTFTIKSLSVPGGSTLTVNSGYNGSTNVNLLDATSSALAAGATDTITLVVNVKLK